MANKHVLSLDVPNTNNDKILRVFDTSVYAKDVKVDCETLSIISPGFNSYVDINVSSGFNLILTACTLGIQYDGCESNLQSLPDGIYTIRYSVSPNDIVYVEYNHLRIVNIINKYYSIMCEIEMSTCEPDFDIKEKLNEMRLIKSFIDAAKSKVEYCHDVRAGMELLIYADKRLNRINNIPCNKNCFKY